MGIYGCKRILRISLAVLTQYRSTTGRRRDRHTERHTMRRPTQYRPTRYSTAR